MNPADLGTRGLTKTQILENTWFYGPTWLKNEEEWPNKIVEVKEVIKEICSYNY